MSSTRRHSGAPRASRTAQAPQASQACEGDDAALQAGDILSVQRARLLSAAIGLLAEEGHDAFSAAAICARAGVSRRTFYEIFHDREMCLLAILSDAEKWTTRVIDGLALGKSAWSEQMRMGLWAILCLAEREPALARVCLIETQRAGVLVQAERARITRRLVELVDEGRSQHPARGAAVTALTAEALVGAVSGVIATRLASADGEDANGVTGESASVAAGGDAAVAAGEDATVAAGEDAVAAGGDAAVAAGGDAAVAAGLGVRGLLGELMGMIVLPYLGSAAARREFNRSLPEVPRMDSDGGGMHTVSPDLFAGLTMRLTYRTARVLAATAQLEQDGSGASNRQIGQHAGISDQGQISKLLRRLQAHGLIVNTADEMAAARGEANSWRLTRAGGRLAHGIAAEALQARTTHETAGVARGARRGCR